jgi:hypothetical protein
MNDRLTDYLLTGLPKREGGSRRPVADHEVHRALQPVIDDDDLTRKRLMSLIWEERVPPTHRPALASALTDAMSRRAGEPAPRAGETWKNAWTWFVWVPVTASVHLFASRHVKWRMYGAGIPFYLDGYTDGGGYAKLFVGWAGAFASIDVLTGPADHVQAVFEVFPGPRPTPESISPSTRIRMSIGSRGATERPR